MMDSFTHTPVNVDMKALTTTGGGMATAGLMNANAKNSRTCLQRNGILPISIIRRKSLDNNLTLYRRCNAARRSH